MPKYHESSSGKVVQCRASTKACPRGDAPHGNIPEEVYAKIEEQNKGNKVPARSSVETSTSGEATKTTPVSTEAAVSSIVSNLIESVDTPEVSENYDPWEDPTTDIGNMDKVFSGAVSAGWIAGKTNVSASLANSCVKPCPSTEALRALSEG